MAVMVRADDVDEEYEEARVVAVHADGSLKVRRSEVDEDEAVPRSQISVHTDTVRAALAARAPPPPPPPPPPAPAPVRTDAESPTTPAPARAAAAPTTPTTGSSARTNASAGNSQRKHAGPAARDEPDSFLFVGWVAAVSSSSDNLPQRVRVGSLALACFS